MPEVTPLLKKLGNPTGALPFYAVYGPGLDNPIPFGGNVITTGTVREAVQKALDAVPKQNAADGKSVAAGK